MLFKDRKEAGKKLAKALFVYKGASKTMVLGLPRGGVVVAFEVAKELALPLDIVVPRKISAPHNPELAIGALAGEAVLLNREILQELAVSQDYLNEAIEQERKEASRRLATFRKGKPPLELRGWTALLVDDGVATGSTIRASIAALEKMGVAKVVIAIPVAPPETLALLREEADEIVCLYAPSHFMAVGQFYELFPQTSDEEVIALLNF